MMDTKIPIKEITDPNSGYLVNKTSIRIHIEWLQSLLLFQATYHHYDDITRIQTYQMRFAYFFWRQINFQALKILLFSGKIFRI